MTSCPHCGKPLTTGRKPKVGLATQSRWNRLTKLEEELAERGIPIRVGELTGHKSRQAFTRLLRLYNHQRLQQHQPPVRMVDFDPWGEHKDAQTLVAQAFDWAETARDQARRWFGVML